MQFSSEFVERFNNCRANYKKHLCNDVTALVDSTFDQMMGEFKTMLAQFNYSVKLEQNERRRGLKHKQELEQLSQKLGIVDNTQENNQNNTQNAKSLDSVPKGKQTRNKITKQEEPDFLDDNDNDFNSLFEEEIMDTEQDPDTSRSSSPEIELVHPIEPKVQQNIQQKQQPKTSEKRKLTQISSSDSKSTAIPMTSSPSKAPKMVQSQLQIIVPLLSIPVQPPPMPVPQPPKLVPILKAPKPTNSLPPLKPPKRTYKCVQCDKTFKSHFCLRQHTRMHTKERPFKCTYCERTYSQLSSLSYHENVFHLQRKQQKCIWEGCDYLGNDLTGAIRHVRTVHFNVPSNRKAQLAKNLMDPEDPKKYLEKIA